MKWEFEQIEGPIPSRKHLELDGWYAPFGRPRQDPVARELLKSRKQTTHLPGGRTKIRSAFGTNYEPMELKGRWMTKAGGKTANEMVDDWTEFFQDQKTIRVAWGTIVSYIGFIEEIEFARESEHEVAWRMVVEIDNRDDIPVRKPVAVRGNALSDSFVAELNLWMTFSKRQLDTLQDSLSPDFFDALERLIGALNEPAASLNKLVGQFRDFSRATYAAIHHARGAITGIRQALVSMRDLILENTIDAVLLVRTAKMEIEWVKYQASWDNQVSLFLEQANLVERELELQTPEILGFIAAVELDTWESLSIRAYGGPEKAGLLREVNGIQYGEQPVPGESYVLQ